MTLWHIIGYWLAGIILPQLAGAGFYLYARFILDPSPPLNFIYMVLATALLAYCAHELHKRTFEEHFGWAAQLREARRDRAERAARLLKERQERVEKLLKEQIP